MANPFVAGEDSDPTAGLPDSDTFSQLQDQWNTFLAKPEGQAALLSFGINMLQPPSFGDNPLAQVGRAIGHAGETTANIEKMDLAQQEAASKEDARAAAARLAEERAAHMGESQRSATESTQAKLELGRLSASVRLNGLYQQERQKIEAINEARRKDVLNAPGSPGYTPPLPIPSYSEFLVTDPIARETAARAGINVNLAPGVTSAPAPATTGLSPADQQALDWANANPGDPRAAQIHTRIGR